MRCYLFNVQSPNYEHLQKLPQSHFACTQDGETKAVSCFTRDDFVWWRGHFDPQSHLACMWGGQAKAVLHGCKVTLWEMRCYLFNVQSPNDEHLEKLPLYRNQSHLACMWGWEAKVVSHFSQGDFVWWRDTLTLKVTSHACKVGKPKLSCILHEVTLCGAGDTSTLKVTLLEDEVGKPKLSRVDVRWLYHARYQPPSEIFHSLIFLLCLVVGVFIEIPSKYCLLWAEMIISYQMTKILNP